MKVLFLDCETTGLDPVTHVPWEIGAVLADHTDDGRLVELDGCLFYIRLTEDEERVANPIALDIGRFAERYHAGTAMWPPNALPVGRAAAAIDALCDDRPHLVGAVPGFDDRRVGDLMRRCGVVPRWHYHLIDVETLVVGALTAAHKLNPELEPSPPLPWNSDDLSRAIGIDPDDFDRHTAMGDVRWAMAQYAAVFGLTVEVAS